MTQTRTEHRTTPTASTIFLGLALGVVAYVAISTIAAIGLQNDLTGNGPTILVTLVVAALGALAVLLVRQTGSGPVAGVVILVLSVLALLAPDSASVVNGTFDLPAALLTGGKSFVAPLLGACVWAAAPHLGTR